MQKWAPIWRKDAVLDFQFMCTYVKDICQRQVGCSWPSPSSILQCRFQYHALQAFTFCMELQSSWKCPPFHPPLRIRKSVVFKGSVSILEKNSSIISLSLLLWTVEGDEMYYSSLLLIKSIPIKIQIQFRENGTCWAQILIMGMISQQFLKLFIQEMGTYMSQREYYMPPVTMKPSVKC